MSKKNGLTPWNELTSDRRRELLIKIEDEFGTDTKFGTNDLNGVLEDDNQTRTRTLTKLQKEDNYLKRPDTGGSPILVARIPNDEDDVAVPPNEQEKLARQMTNREGLSLTPENYSWTVDAQRNAFTQKFNNRATNVHLRATWSRNNYQLRDAAQKVIVNNK